MSPVDSNVPFPAEFGRARKSYRSKYPWAELKTGESFVYDGPLTAAQTNARYASEKHKKKFRAGEHKAQIRVWRTE